MKPLAPLLIALVGLGAGVGAGLALKPAPEPRRRPPAKARRPGRSTPRRPAPLPRRRRDPFEPAPPRRRCEGEPAYVPMDKPFVVPVFAGEKVVAMVVLSLSVATDEEGRAAVEAVQPRLRDSFLKVMFRHANSGGFDGHFTTGRKMDDLKSALLAAAREAMHGPRSPRSWSPRSPGRTCSAVHRRVQRAEAVTGVNLVRTGMACASEGGDAAVPWSPEEANTAAAAKLVPNPTVTR